MEDTEDMEKLVEKLYKLCALCVQANFGEWSVNNHHLFLPIHGGPIDFGNRVFYYRAHFTKTNIINNYQGLLDNLSKKMRNNMDSMRKNMEIEICKEQIIARCETMQVSYPSPKEIKNAKIEFVKKNIRDQLKESSVISELSPEEYTKLIEEILTTPQEQETT